MTTNKEYLINLLSAEGEIIDKMIEALLQERKAIMGIDAQLLTACQLEKETLQLALSTKEEERIIKYGSQSLQELLPSVPLQEQQELRVLQQQIKTKAIQVQEYNKSNRLLLKQTLKHLTQVQVLITGGTEKSYDQSGQIYQQSDSPGKFLSSSA